MGEWTFQLLPVELHNTLSGNWAGVAGLLQGKRPGSLVGLQTAQDTKCPGSGDKECCRLYSAGCEHKWDVFKTEWHDTVLDGHISTRPTAAYDVSVPEAQNRPSSSATWVFPHLHPRHTVGDTLVYICPRELTQHSLFWPVKILDPWAYGMSPTRVI